MYWTKRFPDRPGYWWARTKHGSSYVDKIVYMLDYEVKRGRLDESLAPDEWSSEPISEPEEA